MSCINAEIRELLLMMMVMTKMMIIILKTNNYNDMVVMIDLLIPGEFELCQMICCNSYYFLKS